MDYALSTENDGFLGAVRLFPSEHTAVFYSYRKNGRPMHVTLVQYANTVLPGIFGPMRILVNTILTDGELAQL